MANREQLAIMKQGVDVWNKWRAENPHIEINLIDANLSKAKLSEINLKEAKLTRAKLDLADLSLADLRKAEISETHCHKTIFWGADLWGANLWGAQLKGANLHRANLGIAILRESDLSRANLSQARLKAAKLEGAVLRNADLRESNLEGAELGEADLVGAELIGSNFSRAEIGATIFGHSDLSQVRGLDHAYYRGPSRLATDTFALSHGMISNVFLRGCGLSDWEIEMVKLYSRALKNEEINDIQYRIYDLRATQAIQVSPLFVSYSHEDSEFVNKVSASLNRKGIRHWRDIHDMKAGPLEKQIDNAIRQNPTVLLILSHNSIGSDWVEHEVRAARELEIEMGRHVLCPVALDDNWKSSKWEKRIMEQIVKYNILDFSAWEDDIKFDGMFRKLIDGLELFYKG